MTGSAAQRGVLGERVARKYLENKGLRYIEANWRCKAGEIDLIMQDGNTYVLVEVRLRAKTSYGQGIDTVAFQKQQKLIKAAAWYQQQHRYWGDIRFDIVSIEQSSPKTFKVTHIPHAF